MDKIATYQKILETFCKNQVDRRKNSTDTVETQVIIDKERNHFQVLAVGWRGKRYEFFAIFHFDIKDGKVWVQQNATEKMIGDELVEMGILKSDIVLGFLPAYGRKYTGFAEA